MQINFFEEFPDEKSLAKASLLKHKCVIFIAARSFGAFLVHKYALQKINPLVEAAYWPIINDSYWVSPFANTNELENLHSDLQNSEQKGLKVLIDLELPLKNPKLFLKNLFSFSKNKKIIKSILKDADALGAEIFTAEYPLPESMLMPLGISYSIKKYKHKRIVMYYSSMLNWEKLKNYLKKLLIIPPKKDTHIALGVIKKGIFGTEPIISANNLEKDFDFFEHEASTATIFRLGGLNEKYLDIIEKYQSTN